jgi:phospholipid transport system transporter-binding protein
MRKQELDNELKERKLTQVEINQTNNHWAVTGDVLVDSANSLLEISKTLTIENDAIIDMQGVSEIDTAAVSLMLEWKRRAVTEGRSLKFTNIPKGLASLLQLYEVTDFIN